MNEISILGCGWLGLPLGKAFAEREWYVKGSTTSEIRLELLANVKIEPFLIQLSEKGCNGNLTSFLEGSTILVIAVPPNLRGSTSESFIAKMTNLIPAIVESTIQKVLFISSTSVYGKSTEDGSVTEKTVCQPDTESGRQLLECEQLFLGNPAFKTTVLRFGGLVGPDRNPVTHLVRKENKDGLAPVNLIHLDDCLGVILSILEKEVWNETFNAVSPLHPTRKVYYTQKAKELNLPTPVFTDEKTMGYKVISIDYLAERLGYKFSH